MNRCRTSWVLSLIAIMTLASQSASAQIPRAADAPKPLSPAESKMKMQLPAGFRIELVASEPLVADPSCIAFDEQGHLFVVGIHGYNREGHLDVTELNKGGKLDKKVRRIRASDTHLAEAAAQQHGSLRMLVDKDGDGIMDESILWADDLGPAYGVIAARKGVIVVAAPDVTYFADTDGDGKMDVREVLYTGFQRELLERGINCPRLGPDNWIYVGAGGHRGKITGPHLKKPSFLEHSDFRFKADGTAIESVTGSVGTFGLALHEFGDRFPCTGGQPAIYSLPLEQQYLLRNPNVPAPHANHSAVAGNKNYNKVFRASNPHPWRVQRHSDPAWIRYYGRRETDSSFYTAGCGGEFYYASLFPEQFRGNFFMCEPSQNVITRRILNTAGAGYRAHRAPGEEQKEFIASTDQWFRPINLHVGPDGAMYVIDMYREIIEDYSAIPRFLQQQYGLIEGDDWGRIWRLVPEDAPKYSTMNLVGVDSAELVKLLDDANVWRRNAAQRLLLEKNDISAAPALAILAKNGKTGVGRMLALRTLELFGKLTPAEVLHALSDENYGVRLHALQLSEKWINSDKAMLAKVVSMTADDNARIRLQVALTLGESPDASAMEALLLLARVHGDDSWMTSAILSSSNDRAGEMIAALLQDKKLSKGAIRALSPLSVTVGARQQSKPIAKVLSSIVGHEPSVQVSCLAGLAKGLTGRQAPTANEAARGPITSLLASSSPEVRTNTIRLASMLYLSDMPEMKAAFAIAVKQALDSTRSLDDRKAAIALLASSSYEITSAATEKLLDVRQPLEVQLAAIGALGSLQDGRVGDALLAGWKGYTPKVQDAVLKAILGRQNRLAALLSAVEDGTIRASEINPGQREQISKSRDEKIVARATALFDGGMTDAELSARIEKYTKALGSKPDLERGKFIYTSVCASCHQLGDQGFAVGPNMSEVANKPNETILLDLLDPQRSIQSEFRSYLVETVDGRLFTGLLASDSATSVTLKQAEGKTESILRKDIEEIEASGQSLMPSNLHEKVSPKDAASLIAYLRQAFSELSDKKAKK